MPLQPYVPDPAQLDLLTLTPRFMRTVVTPDQAIYLRRPDALREIEDDRPQVTPTSARFRMPQNAAQQLALAILNEPRLIPVVASVFEAYNLVYARLSRTRIEECECDSCVARRGNTVRVLRVQIDYILCNHHIASFGLVIGSATNRNRSHHRRNVHRHAIARLDEMFHGHAYWAQIRQVITAIDMCVDILYDEGVEADTCVTEDSPFIDPGAGTMDGVRGIPTWVFSQPIVAVGPVSASLRYPELESERFTNAYNAWVHRITATLPTGGRQYHPLAVAVYRNRYFIVPLALEEADLACVHEFGETIIPIQARLIGLILHAVGGGRTPEITFATMVRDWLGHHVVTCPTGDVNVRCEACGLHGDASSMTTHPRVSFARGQPITTREARVCPSCVDHGENMCHVCNTGVLGSMFNHRVPGDDARAVRHLCGRCFSEGGYRACQNCGDAFLVQRGARNHSICSRCASQNIIRRHCDDPELNPKGEGPRFFGVELEVVSQIDRAAAAAAVTKWWNGDAIVKHDGSLPNTGFEIVTRPGDLAWHREMWLKFLITERKQSGAASLRSFGESSCGFHVHYSKNAITDIARGKLLAFICAPENDPVLSMLAGRSSNNYCIKKADIKPGTCNGIAGTSHYSAVNLCNVATDEVRIFKGTMNAKRVLLYLDFVDSLMDFCSQELVSIKQGKDNNLYRKYVTERKAKWPYINCYFEYGDAWLRRAIYDIPHMFTLPAPNEAATAE